MGISRSLTLEDEEESDSTHALNDEKHDDDLLNDCNKWKSFSSFHKMKSFLIISFLHCSTGLFINIPDNIIKTCIDFVDNHHLKLFELRYIMIEQQQNGHYPISNISSQRSSYYIHDDTIHIFNELKLDKNMIAKCDNVRIIVLNDVYINERIQFDQKHFGGNIYIQCNNLYINDMGSILTLNKQYRTDKGYKQLLMNNDKKNELRKYRDGKIFINVENNIKLIDRACIQSGYIAIYCGNDLELTDRGRITGYGNHIDIQIGGNFIMFHRGLITAHNGSVDIETMQSFIINGKGEILADKYIEIKCKDKQISDHCQLKNEFFTFR